MMATLDELEAALRSKWDRDTLAVYADHLQSLGELRGELIAIDLRIEEAGELPGLVARRKELLSAWLRTLPPGKVRHGFFDVDATGCEPVEQLRAALASPAAPYIRTIAIVGPPPVLREAVGVIAGNAHPALVRLVVRQWSEGAGPTIDARMFQQLVLATPNLDTLEVDGYHVFDDLVHPSLRRLRISGWSAISSIGGAGSCYPALAELDFAFACHLGDRHAPAPAPADVISRRRVASLLLLDLSRNEPGEADPIHLGGATDVFAFLERLDVHDTLRHLRLPKVVHQAQLSQLRSALGHMPRLERLEVRDSELRELIVHPTAEVSFFS